MPAVVRMPALAAGAVEAAVQTWLVEVGDTVTAGQSIVEIETEKAVVEVETETGGVVAALLVPAGSSGAVGEPIAVIAVTGEAPEAAISAAGAAAPVASAPAAAEHEAGADAPPLAVRAEERTDAARELPAEAPRRLFASPLVRRLARERGIDLTTLHGSGPHGRFVRRDLDDLAATAPVAPAAAPRAPAPVPAALPGAGYIDISHTGMRRAIARRLTESTTTVPHFQLVSDCRVDEVLELRTRLIERAGARVSVNDFVVKAVAAALRDVPEANAIWTADATRRFDAADIGIAVSVPGGLVTPVIRGVDRLSLGELAAATRDVAERARAGRLKQAELDGGSFAVSNLGMYGTKEFSAIINPPHAGILAVGAASRRAVVDDEDRIVAASVMTVTLSADHRVLDGALAAQWLAAFTARIENPLSLLV